MTALPRFVLASKSPARLQTLRNAGLNPQVMVSGVDESAVTGPPADVALTLAVRKAMAVAPQCADSLVLGCDSLLDLDGEALGRPTGRADAIARWRRMRARSGVLHTGHCLIDTATNRQAAQVASTTVYFADLTDDEIAEYVDTGEPLDVAGAFTIDGLGGPFVERIDGDPHNVVGVSLPLLRELVMEIGHRWSDLWDGGHRLAATEPIPREPSHEGP